MSHPMPTSQIYANIQQQQQEQQTQPPIGGVFTPAVPTPNLAPPSNGMTNTNTSTSTTYNSSSTVTAMPSYMNQRAPEGWNDPPVVAAKVKATPSKSLDAAPAPAF